MTEDIYTAKSFKFSWGHTQAPSSADGCAGAPSTASISTGGECTSGTRCAPGPGHPGPTPTMGHKVQQHSCGDGSASPGGQDEVSTPGGTGLPRMMTQVPRPCSKDVGATGAGLHLPHPKAPWAKPVPSHASAQGFAVLVMGSETTSGLRPEITARSSATVGLGESRGRGTRCASPAP